jgi:hypothetical protein
VDRFLDTTGVFGDTGKKTAQESVVAKIIPSKYYQSDDSLSLIKIQYYLLIYIK